MAMQEILINGQTFLVNLTLAPRDQQKARDYGSSLLEYTHPALAKTHIFEYSRLVNEEKKIRLLRLREGNENDTIKCEIFDVKYNDSHRPIHNGKEVEYEALSWCWGTEEARYAISINQDGINFKKAVTRELALALRYLRKKDVPRTLWIDAICINQEDHTERNHQVQMMSLIYTRATEVCVWLGEDDQESRLAIEFIKKKIMNLKDFDSVSSNKNNVEYWRSLLMLMQRPWFSRRWVVQEIALAQKATVFCGWDSIKWTDFAVAVELFVEVETATHRLSEVMQKDPKYYHVPGWFEHVSQLGASLLVQATGKVFRQYESVRGVGQETQKELNPGVNGTMAMPETEKEPLTTVDPRNRRGLLSLEYLVSSMSTFKASEPRDVIYSLLAIAKDTAPVADLSAFSSSKNKESLLMTTFASFMETKPYIVDYGRPYTDVCKDFISFCIERACASDPTRALDILCRPWAPAPAEGDSTALKQRKAGAGADSGQKTTIQKERTRILPIDLIWEKRKWKRSIEGSDPRNKASEKIEDTREKSVYWKDAEKIWADQTQWPRRGQRKKLKDRIFPSRPKDEKLNGGKSKMTTERAETMELHRAKVKPNGQPNVQPEQKHPDAPEGKKKDLSMPSWVASIDGAAFALFPHPGMNHIEKVGRKNADPLVGLPQEGQRNYSAAQTKVPDKKTLRFKKRPFLRQYSMYVKGFILDEIDIVAPHSQRGAIDLTWAKVGGWAEAQNEKRQKAQKEEGGEEIPPPEDFWRTLVADRGKDNRNPPYYYAKACKESFAKGGIESGSVDTTALINNEQNSIIAEFCRRVQAVIWNRSLIRTKNGTLGLASQHVRRGDLVCIIYGCTVPVILRRSEKSKKTRKGVTMCDLERFEDQVEALKNVMRRLEQTCIRKHQKYPFWKEQDSAWKSALKEEEEEGKQDSNEVQLSLAERLDKEGVKEEDLRSQETYVREIQEETAAINRKIKVWNRYKKDEDKRREVTDKLKKIDDRRVKDQESRRKQLLLKAKNAKTNNEVGNASKNKVGAIDDKDNGSKPGTSHETPIQPDINSEDDFLDDMIEQRHPSDEENMDPGYTSETTRELSNNAALADIATDSPVDGDSSDLHQNANILLLHPTSASQATQNNGATTPIQHEQAKNTYGAQVAKPKQETTIAAVKPIDNEPWYIKWRKDLDELEENLKEKWTEDDHFYYKFLGESYIHGMMDGEAVREQFQNQQKVEKQKKASDTLIKFAERVFELR